MKNIGKLLFVAILLTSALRWPVVVARAGGVGSIDCSTQKEAIAMGQCTGKCQSTFGSCFGGCPASGQNYACWDELAEYSSNGSTIYYMDTTCSYIISKLNAYRTAPTKWTPVFLTAQAHRAARLN